MLGDLLRRAAPYNGFHSKAPSGVGDVYGSPRHSNSTITGENGAAYGCYEEDYGSSVPCHTTAPPMLDHVSDTLRYKLFGSKNVVYSLPFQSAVLSSYAFRVVIAEETGHMMHRNHYSVVFDYSTAKSASMDQIRPNELKEYIFGSPIRSSDSSKGNKFRSIPNSELVMITRTFFFEARTNNRLALSLCVPNILLPVISEVWSDVSRWFDQCQGIVLGMLKAKARSLSGGGSPNDGYLPQDLELVFPKECESIVTLLRNKLIPCLRSTSEIPRLFLCPETSLSFVETWFKDVFNWLEIKDGPRLNFLQALLAKVICDFQNPPAAKDTTRIVIMSGNMVVANKLIFIISGLLKPRYKGNIDVESKAEHSVDFPESQKNESGKKEIATHEKSNTDLSKYLSTKNAWEIPRENSVNSRVSLSSDESLAYVIQPSSLKSVSNSVQCLSSSLSSQHGSSYGSWFNKRGNGSQATLNSPSVKPDHWDSVNAAGGHVSGVMSKTGSSSSLHQFYLRGSGVTPQPSPSISELEEYPWFGTGGSPRPENNQTWHPTSKNSLSGVPLGALYIKRDCQRLSQDVLLDKAFERICKPKEQGKLENGEYEIIPGDSRHAAFLQLDVDYVTAHQERPLELLPKYTTYLAHFNHWFHLQAFPVSADSESQVVLAMRRDLQARSSTRSLLISLRSREIKELCIMRNQTPPTGRSHHGIIQKTKKIFNNGKCGNVSTKLQNCIAYVSESIRRAMLLYEDTEIAPQQRNEELMLIFQSLLFYNDS